MREGFLIVGGLLALGAGGLIIYEVSKKPSVTPAPAPAPAPPTPSTPTPIAPGDPNGWVPVAAGTSLPAGTEIAVAINNPPAAIVSFLMQFTSPAVLAASNITGVALYPVGTVPQTDWPSGDTYGLTAFRIKATMKIAGAPLTIPAGITASMWRK